MANIIKSEGPFLVHKQTANGLLVHQMPEGLTNEQKAILAAYTQPAISNLTDVDLLARISGMISRALVELGHKNSLADDRDFKIMQNAIFSDIREKYAFFSVQDLELIFKFGTRGDFKSKPDDVVFLNREQFNRWLKCYHSTKRADVVSALKPVEPKAEAPAEYDPETDLVIFIQRVKKGEKILDTEWICQTAQHYERLNKENAFDLTNEQRRAIFQEEKEKLIQEGKNQMLHGRNDTKFLFRAFMENAPGDNPYQKEVTTICRIRVFREYVQREAQ